MRWLAPAAAVAVAALAGFAFAHLYATPSLPGPQLAVEQRLMCPQCTSTRLDVCDRPICQDMKLDIARRLAAGEPADSIVAAYRLAYGAGVVSESQAPGVAALPGLLVAAVLLLGLLSLGRRRRGPRPAADSSSRP